jgi:hypothetical protein
MLGLIVLLIVGVIVWKLWMPALSFAQGFKSLLDRPTGDAGLWPFLKGRETVGGEYDGRPALLVLHHKRGRNTLGYLVVAMQPAAGVSLEGKYSGPFREWVSEPAARAAWETLELQEALKLTFADGWMRATWQPHGLFIFLPGRVRGRTLAACAPLHAHGGHLP